MHYKMAAERLHLVMLAVITLAGGSLAAAVARQDVFFMEVEMEEMERMAKGPVDASILPDLVKNLGLTDLYKAVGKAGLAQALSAKGPLTLFAPTNEAFDKAEDFVEHLLKNVTALKEVLTYHVLGPVGGKAVLSKDIKDELTIPSLMGQPIRFNIYPNNGVVTAQCVPIDLKSVDNMASNGVLHELKMLMVPPQGNIVETVLKLDDFKTLVEALTKADLVDTLAGPGPFTVFAPTDAAFRKLDPQTLDNLLKNKTALTDVLLYHVTKLTYCRAGLESYKTIEMLNKKEIQITVDDEECKVNDIRVRYIGVQGGVTNGVIHKIDRVLIPPSLHL